MMTPKKALSLTLHDKVKFGKETLTVIDSIDVGTHKEPLLISDAGKKYYGTLFIAHLLTLVGEPQQLTIEDDISFEADEDEAVEATSVDQALTDDEEENEDPADVTPEPQPSPVLTLPEPVAMDDQSTIPDDELELVKAYALNELI